MEQYIPKSALVAEIKKRIKNLYPKGGQGIVVTKILKDHYEDFLSSLDTLEVKEVDLDKASDDYIYTHDGRKRLALELDWKYCNLTLKGGNEIIKFAKHFFELGMQVSNKAQKGESV